MRKTAFNVSLAAITLLLIFSRAAPALAAENQLPIITVWYEQNLKFGQSGNPQTQINILGNVRDPDGSVNSLTYKLNGGPTVTLSLGPDGQRLNNPGDFDAAINTSSLLNGSNNLVFTAADNGGGIQTHAVTINYTRGKVWPLPYTTNWADASSIQDQAQVVDGIWSIGPNGIQPTLFGYDRLVAIGDVSWTNYEILVPITIRAFYPNPADPTDAGGVGIIARWQGHVGSGQPPEDWTRLGAYGYYSNRLGALALRLNATDPVTQGFSFSYNTTYLFKLRAETVAQGGRYSLKVWRQGQPEPDWTSSQFSKIVNLVDSNNDLLNGSMLLVAHRADATFGNVTVCPPNVNYSLTVNKLGNGIVVAQPGKTSYACGEGVTLTAQPSPGWIFSGWKGDVTGQSSSVSFNMVKTSTVTANFSLALNQPYKSFIPITRQ
jgi:uncharacterized repeat protein (TIGR02543 family)